MRRHLSSLLGRLAARIAPPGESSSRPTEAEASDLAAMLEGRLELVEQRLGALADVSALVHGTLAVAAADALPLLDERHRDPRSITRGRGQVFSQNAEDGIIAEILARIGVEERLFVEIGVGSGVENNTRLLLETGWSGVWLEADEAAVATIRTLLAPFLSDGRLALAPGLVTRENVAATLDARLAGRHPDVLSIDIDYNTSHVWAALAHLRPRLAVIEYNAHFPPQVDFEVPYDPQGSWRHTTRFGASLKALERIGAAMGYRLVGCDLFGVNAFFVREDLCDEERFLAPFTAERHYEPPRFEFVRMRGHPRHPGPLAGPVTGP